MNDSPASVKARGSTTQLVRYGLVGIVSNLSGYLIYLFITYWGGEPKLTMTLVYAIGATIGFFGNRQWAFAHKGNMREAAIRFCIAHSLGYLLNFLILYAFVDQLGYAHQWVQAVAIVVVAGFLFSLFRFYVFSAKDGLPGKS